MEGDEGVHICAQLVGAPETPQSRPMSRPGARTAWDGGLWAEFVWEWGPSEQAVLGTRVAFRNHLRKKTKHSYTHIYVHTLSGETCVGDRTSPSGRQ